MVLTSVPVVKGLWHGRPFPRGLCRGVVNLPANLLNDGLYRIELFMVMNQTLIYDQKDFMIFEVHDADERQGNWFGEWPGVVRPDLKWRTELVEVPMLATGQGTSGIGKTV